MLAYILCFIFLCRNTGVLGSATTTHQTGGDTIQNNEAPKSVTILGLGGMGMAVVKCIASSSSVQVHAWNRGAAKRQALKEMELSNVYVHESMADAIQSSNIVMTMIDDWEGTVQMIRESSKTTSEDGDIWKISTEEGKKTGTREKILLLFSTYSPKDIQDFYQKSGNATGSTMGGAIVGVPQTICSPKAFILSSGDQSNQEVNELLDTLGTHVSFVGDSGLAPLANIALIQTITFGIAGHEMSQLLFQKYPGVNDDFVQKYNSFVTQVVPTYIGMLMPLISKGIPYVPAKTFLNVMNLHMKFMIDLGISDDTYLSGYIKYLQRVTEETSNDKYGPADWIRHAVVTSTSNMKDDTDSIGSNDKAKSDEL